MEIVEGMHFSVVNDDGAEIECEALFTFDCEETGKNYLVYTDNSIDEDGNTNIYCVTFDPKGGTETFGEVETEEEWEMIQEELDNIISEFGAEE